MDTKKEGTDVKAAPEHQQCQHLVNLDLDLALDLRTPYMGQWTWRRIRWKDFSRPSGPSQSRSGTLIL